MIHSSLAIEGNTLTESQFSDLLEGRRVIAPVRQIQEVKNAIATYDVIAELDPFDVNDLLRSHSILMTALDDRPGEFRQGGVVHDNQQAYYDAINESTKRADSGVFIDFMLTEIHESLKLFQHDHLSDGAVSGAVNRVLAHISAHPGIRANAVADALNIPLRSVQRYLTRLKSENNIEFRGAPRNGGSHVKDEC